MTQPAAAVPRRLVVIGTGLIGTSVALAARGLGAAVWLADLDPAAARFAAGLGAGDELPQAGPPGGPADLAVLAMPPAAVAPALAAAQERGLAGCYTDVASVKELPLARARELGCELASFVPGHPLAGRERSGPAAARADLFLGRPWAICPVPETSAEATAAVAALASACGAQPALMPAIAEDLTAAGTALTEAARGDDTSLKRLADLLDRGGAGVARIPGKQGGPAPAYTVVQVVIGDQPGELARVFDAAGQAGINIEDVRIEHSPGLPSGVLELSVSPLAADGLIEALAGGGWPVRR